MTWHRTDRFQDMMTPADFSTMDDIEDYAEYSQSSLLYLTLEAMGIKDENTEFIASHLGVCKGILTLLRAHPVHMAQVNKSVDLVCRWNTCAVTHASLYMIGPVLLPKRSHEETWTEQKSCHARPFVRCGSRATEGRGERPGESSACAPEQSPRVERERFACWCALCTTACCRAITVPG